MSDDEIIDLFNIQPILKRLPGNLKAFSVPVRDGYGIVVNDALGPEERLQALLHELDHIRAGDHGNPDYNEYE